MGDPQAAADALVDAANEAGGGDDMTVVVVDAVAIRPSAGFSTSATTRTGDHIVTRARWRV